MKKIAAELNLLSKEELLQKGYVEVDKLFNDEEMRLLYRKHLNQKTKLGLVKFLHNCKFYERVGENISSILTFLVPNYPNN